MKLFLKILFFILAMLITVGEIKSSTVINLSQEATAYLFQQTESNVVSVLFENSWLKKEKVVSYRELGTVIEGNAAKGGANLIDDIAVHGNSLKSMRPTWGYKLYSNKDVFLKNGITSKPIPQQRYTKAFMYDKYMVPVKQFPNRLDAWNWEYQQNLIKRGLLNRNMH